MSVVITVPTWIRGRPAARDVRAWRPFVGEHGQMAATVGIDRGRVLDTAIELIDAEGYDTLSMTKLAASLGIRVPSLYAYVTNLDHLQRELQVQFNLLVADLLRDATAGLTPERALEAAAFAPYRFGREHPGLMVAGIRPVAGSDRELKRLMRQAQAPVSAALAAFGVYGDDLTNWNRTIWSSIYGYVLLINAGSMVSAVPHEGAVRLMVGTWLTLLADGQAEAGA